MKSNFFFTALFIICCTAANAQSAHLISYQSKTAVEKPTAPKKNVVTIDPNPSYNGTISVSTKAQSELHFYIFDLEGTLIYQAVIKDKQKKQISNLIKGTYLYNVFLNDESIEEGKLFVK
jgi:hypothetical protein